MEQTPKSRLGDHIIRAATALVVGRAKPGGEERYLAEREKAGDHITTRLIRSASAPHTIANTPTLALTIVADYLASLAPQSAGGALVARCLSLAQGGGGQYGVTLPTFKPTSSAGAFVSEGQPIPVEQFVAAGPTIEPKKLGMISALTREMARSTNAEALIRQVMTASSALTLDKVLFSAGAATDAAPAGLLNGVTPITAATGGGDGAFRADMVALLGALAVGVRSDVVLIANPVTALKIRLIGRTDLPFAVFPTEEVAAGTVIAVGVDGLVFAGGTDPKVDVSGKAVLHMEDGTPVPIGVAGSPNKVAGPAVSLFQTEQIAIRLILDISWTQRVPGTVAIISGVTW